MLDILVLKLVFGESSMLFTGDISQGIEKNLYNVKADILKVAHHGSKDSTPEAFLEVIQPTLSVISCGERKVYGHPHEEALYRLAAVGSKVMTTAGKGAIVIEVGDEVRVRRWGKPD